jgi:hypothetical protein
MSDWPTIDAAANSIMQETFGEPVLYQPVESGAAVGSPLTITAVRHARPPEESGTMAGFEEISVNPSDFSTPPAKGDWVTAWGTQYVVTTLRHCPPALVGRCVWDSLPSCADEVQR